MKCSHCGSERAVKAGKNHSGSQRYVCKECSRHFTPDPNSIGYEVEVVERAVKMVVDGTNMRRTGRFLGVNHQSVANWMKRATQQIKPEGAPLPKVGEWDIVEMDELFSFVGSKKTKSMSSRKFTVKRGVS
jgi:transposase-like protein